MINTYRKLYKKDIIALMLGSGLECYDSLLYLSLIGILSPLFFPNNNSFISILLMLQGYAVGYFIRPLGGIILAHYGDKLGRKKILTLTMTGTALATCIIGILPSYAQIGVLAPILLIGCRLFQSFFIGAEISGAACYLFEIAPQDKKCSFTCFTSVFFMFGGILSTFLGFLCSHPLAPNWSWRVPFILGGLLYFIGSYLRKELIDSPAFIQAKSKNELLDKPAIELIKDQTFLLLCCIGLSAGVLPLMHLIMVYLPYVYHIEYGLQAYQVLSITLLMMCLIAFMLPIMGNLGDKISPNKLSIYLGVVCIFILFLLIYFLNIKQYLFKIILCEMLFCIPVAGIMSVINVQVSNSYVTSKRYSGNAISWGIGSVIFGGLSPIVFISLNELGNNKWYIFLFLLGCQFIYFSSLYFMGVNPLKRSASELSQSTNLINL